MTNISQLAHNIISQSLATAKTCGNLIYGAFLTKLFSRSLPFSQQSAATATATTTKLRSHEETGTFRDGRHVQMQSIIVCAD
jgi:hypothetical protein